MDFRHKECVEEFFVFQGSHRNGTAAESEIVLLQETFVVQRVPRITDSKIEVSSPPRNFISNERYFESLGEEWIDEILSRPPCVFKPFKDKARGKRLSGVLSAGDEIRDRPIKFSNLSQDPMELSAVPTLAPLCLFVDEVYEVRHLEAATKFVVSGCLPPLNGVFVPG